jgi:hypothetical protein
MSHSTQWGDRCSSTENRLSLRNDTLERASQPLLYLSRVAETQPSILSYVNNTPRPRKRKDGCMSVPGHLGGTGHVVGGTGTAVGPEINTVCKLANATNRLVGLGTLAQVCTTLQVQPGEVLV